MTSRRRVATMSFSPVQATAPPTMDLNDKISLERKLELLEARFTMPLAYQQPRQTRASSASTNDSSDGSSPATLDPEKSSPALPNSGSTANNSQHSFGFDTPSLSYQNSFTKTDSSVERDKAKSSDEGKHSTAMKTNSPTPKWEDVAVAHMEKVAQQSQDNTLLTSHVRSSQNNAQSQTQTTSVCVKESPPFISPKAKDTVAAVTTSNDTAQQQKKENKRKSMMPVKRNQHSVKQGVAVVSSAEPQDQQRKRTRLQFDKQQQSKTKSPLRCTRNSKSATGSNSPRLTGDENSKQSEPKASRKISNNAKIDDFFATTKKRSKPASKSSTDEPVTSSHDTQTLLVSSGKHPSQPPKRAKADSTDSSQKSAQHERELERLRQQCHELQQSCQDKDEQLKAVSNNRTILHSALQASLRQREQEIITLQQKSTDRETQTARVLEDLVRADACQEAREIREKLAADGARLGRIVTAPAPPSRGPSRMLMQRAVMESWEEGHASKLLQKRRNEIQKMRAVLEERQKAAYEAEKRVMQQQSASASGIASATQTLTSDIDKNNDDDEESPVASINKGEFAHVAEGNDSPLVVGGIEIRTILDAREAVESVRWHLSNLRRKEQELAMEEQSLNEEKGSHIRALKRVASEDASRFRSRPKLHDRYVLQSLLGKGGFSEVWRAYDLVELREVAVKIHQLDSRWPDAKKESYTKHVSREYEIQRNVRHPRIVSLYDVFEIDNNSFATVLECCDGTDLDTLLKTKRRLVEPDARAILLQILSGMNYLSHPSEDGSRQGIIHYDLKPGNILFDEFGDAKITDFGLSKIIDSQDPSESMELTSQGAGTYWYLPPECFVMSENVRISNKVDVWSIGVIFYQMLFGRRPFGDGQSQDRILADKTMLNAHDVQFPDKPQVSDMCKQFIRTCLTYDQSFRPSIAELCQNSYVLASTETITDCS